MRTLVLIIVLPLCMMACGKTKQYYITNQQLRDAMNIKEGSYFVYKDSATGELDTITVQSYGHFMYEDRALGTGSYESIQVLFKESDNTWCLRGIISGQYSSRMNKIFVAITRGWLARVMVFPFMTSDTAIWDEGEKKYFSNDAYYESFTVQNKLYSKVYQTTSDADGLYFRSYMSLESGVVQYSMQIDSEYKTFYLIDSKIIR